MSYYWIARRDSEENPWTMRQKYEHPEEALRAYKLSAGLYGTENTMLMERRFVNLEAEVKFVYPRDNEEGIKV